MRFRLSLLLSLFVLTPALAQGDKTFALANGDHVVLLGNALIEHDRFHGAIEAALRRHHPSVRFTVRNLGWSGDTVKGEARTSGYQNPEGLPRLIKEVKAQKPTVLILGYGMNESFAGSAALEPFLKLYGKLLNDLDLPKTRVVLLSPTWHEDLGRPLPEPAEHNVTLERFTAEMKKFADKNQFYFVDVFHPLQVAKSGKKEPLTTNGILLNELGYWHLGIAIERGLGFDPLERVVIKSDGQGKLEPAVLAPRPRPGTTLKDIPVIITGLPAGRHVLSLEGVSLAVADAKTWREGVVLSAAPFVGDAETLRQATLVRNDLFFRGWRPYNDHSRHWGFMAKDFKTFDDLAARQDDAIDALRVGRAASLEIVPEKK